ncbi:MAG: DDE-type integrase/transposase/recombinase [Planctomycetota bacterium]
MTASSDVIGCTVIDGCSRRVVAWDIAAKMGEEEIEILLQQGRERFPHAHPRISSDNGPQFIANDFKQFVKIIDDTKRAVGSFAECCNTQRLRSAIGCVTPLDSIEGRQKAIPDERDRKLEEARQARAERRRQEKSAMPREASRQPPDSDVPSNVSQEDRALPGSNPSA